MWFITITYYLLLITIFPQLLLERCGGWSGPTGHEPAVREEGEALHLRRRNAQYREPCRNVVVAVRLVGYRGTCSQPRSLLGFYRVSRRTYIIHVTCQWQLTHIQDHNSRTVHGVSITCLLLTISNLWLNIFGNSNCFMWFSRRPVGVDGQTNVF